MRPTTATHSQTIDPDFDALVHPGTVFEHPREVVAHPALGRSGGALIRQQHRNLISNKNHNCNARPLAGPQHAPGKCWYS